MPRKRKSGIDYWLENCFRCSNMIRSHYLINGVDNCTVSFKCAITGEYVTPWHIDGCKKFDVGTPQEVIINEVKEEKKNENGENPERPGS